MGAPGQVYWPMFTLFPLDLVSYQIYNHCNVNWYDYNELFLPQPQPPTTFFKKKHL